MPKSSKRTPYATNVHEDLGLQSLGFEFQIKIGLADF
jgi:hypothetical protein